MKTEKVIRYLLILGVIGVFVLYTILTITFKLSDVLREESGLILTQFHQGVLLLSLPGGCVVISAAVFKMQKQ